MARVKVSSNLDGTGKGENYYNQGVAVAHWLMQFNTIQTHQLKGVSNKRHHNNIDEIVC